MQKVTGKTKNAAQLMTVGDLIGRVFDVDRKIKALGTLFTYVGDSPHEIDVSPGDLEGLGDILKDCSKDLRKIASDLDETACTSQVIGDTLTQ